MPTKTKIFLTVSLVLIALIFLSSQAFSLGTKSVVETYFDKKTPQQLVTLYVIFLISILAILILLLNKIRKG